MNMAAPAAGGKGSSVSVGTKALNRALSNAATVINRRNNIPILSCARLTALGGGVRVTGTDMDMTVTTNISWNDGDRVTDIVIPDPGRVSRIFKRSVADQIQITPRADGAALSAGKMEWVSNNPLCADDFPELPPTYSVIWAATLGRESVNILRRVAVACASEKTRYYLCGVFLHEVAGQLKGVATNGHRIHIGTIAAPDAAGLFPSSGVIVPRQAMDVLFRLSDQDKCEPVRVSLLAVEKSDLPIVEFRIGTVTLRTKVIDGTFPDYARILPGKSTNHATFFPDELVAGIAAVTAGIRKLSRSALRIEFAEVCAKISCEWNYRGSKASIDIDATHDMGSVALGINPQYLLEGIKAIGAKDSVSLAFVECPSGGSHFCQPIALHSPNDATFSVVLMPMRLHP